MHSGNSWQRPEQIRQEGIVFKPLVVSRIFYPYGNVFVKCRKISVTVFALFTGRNDCILSDQGSIDGRMEWLILIQVIGIKIFFFGQKSPKAESALFREKTF